jgi:hypothetical protein
VQKYDQILISCIRTNFDITEDTELIIQKLELWFSVKQSGFKKYNPDWFWLLAMDSFAYLLGAKTNKTKI